MIEIRIDIEKCKGCGLCVVCCPKKVLKISEKSNQGGLFPVEIANIENCTVCGNCWRICPDACIEIYEDE